MTETTSQSGHKDSCIRWENHNAECDCGFTPKFVRAKTTKVITRTVDGLVYHVEVAAETDPEYGLTVSTDDLGRAEKKLAALVAADKQRPYRDIRAVLAEMLLLIPTFPHVPIREQNDPVTEAWRANNVRGVFQRLADEAIYAPAEVQHHYWMRTGVVMKEHFPDHLAMGVVAPDGVRIDGSFWKRNLKKLPDPSPCAACGGTVSGGDLRCKACGGAGSVRCVDAWERAVMRVWLPEYFEKGGRWALETESGAMQ